MTGAPGAGRDPWEVLDDAGFLFQVWATEGVWYLRIESHPLSGHVTHYTASGPSVGEAAAAALAWWSEDL